MGNTDSVEQRAGASARSPRPGSAVQAVPAHRFIYSMVPSTEPVWAVHRVDMPARAEHAEPVADDLGAAVPAHRFISTMVPSTEPFWAAQKGNAIKEPAGNG